MDINNKVVVITGGANGIGKACVKEFLKEDAIIVIADVDKENGMKLTRELGDTVNFFKTDVAKEEDVINLKNYIMTKFGRIDILINNAAKQTENKFFEMKPEEFKRIIDTNLNGTYMCSNILGKEMKRGSKILNMLSVHYDKPRKYKYHYDASKAGIAILTKEIALELVNEGITVNGVSYGACRTSMNSEWIDDINKMNKTLEKIPMKWIAEPEEIAVFVVNILKNFCDYTTGSIFTIDGGRSLS